MRGEEWCLGTWRILYGSPDSMVAKPLLIALRLSFDTCLGLVWFLLLMSVPYCKDTHSYYSKTGLV